MKTFDFSKEFTYPDPVMDYSHKVTNALNEDNFFNEEEINPRIFFNRLCENVLPNWINGDSLQLTEDQMMEVITHSAAQSVLQTLEQKGLLDSITGEDGEERFFLTADGKIMADLILEEDKKNKKDK